ncbi:flavodoxin domain-containing protein [uncultured Sulfitobacter sp.]|uniref:flavodoxin domain-containing protein n=1 Tax=uncultured Sulfitobacter sp. TaxID=191468 RepID=UPI002637E3E1|nr:flavodoxin domain-containing protein [uncultured Sulfitobacter sp.]
MQVLVLFASIEGQTRKIADFVDAQVRRAGHESTLVDASEKRAVVTFEGYDTVILAAPVHERRHPPNFEIVLTASRADLAARRTMMISVSLGAAFPELREEAQEYLEEMKMRTRLQPDAEVLVGGAVRPSSYGYYETEVLRHAVLRNQNIDPRTQEHEFTDWDMLEDAVGSFIATAA